MDINAVLATFVSTTAMLSLVLIFTVLRTSNEPCRYTYAVLQILVVLLLLGYVMEVNTPDIAGKMLWNDLEYAGHLLIPTLALIFLMQYSKMDRKFVRSVSAAVLAVSITFLFSVVTNDYHHMVYVSVEISEDLLGSFDADHGFLYFVMMAFIIAEMITGLLLIVSKSRTANTAMRGRYTILFFGLLAPMTIVFISFLISGLPVTLLEISGLLISGMLLFIGTFYFDIFQATPSIMDVVLRSLDDGLVILDERSHPIYLNAFAASLMNVDVRDPPAAPIYEMLTKLPAPMIETLSSSKDGEAYDIELRPNRFFDMKANVVRSGTNRFVGHVMLIHEVTESKRSAERMARALKQLGIMNGISRHDLSNELLAIQGNLDMAEIEGSIGSERVSRMKKLVKTMDTQITFMKKYQDLGKNEPEWQDVRSIFTRAVGSIHLDGVKIDIDVDMEVFADLLFERVLFNLLDNSMKHGGKVTRISLTHQRNGEGMTLTYSDDGNGIPAEERSGDLGKMPTGMKGYGMFLGHEILALTGIDFSEDGEEGEGVRFNMHIPKGRFRTPSVEPGHGPQ